MGMSYTLLLSIFYLASGVFIFLLGLTILRTGRASTPKRATALMLFFAGVGPILSATSIILQGTLKEDAIVYRSMLDNFEYLWEFYFPSLLLFAMTYPRELRFFSGFGFLGVLVFAPYIFHLVMIIAGEGLFESVVDLSKELPLEGEVSLGERTVSLGRFSPVLSVVLTTLAKLHRQLFVVVNVAYATIALVFLWRSQRQHVNPRTAGPLRTVLIGLTVSIAGYMLAKLVRALPGSGHTDDVSLALTNFALVAGGGSVAYAVIKQQFLGIRYVARKSVLYGGAAILFAGVYMFVVKPVSDYFGQYSAVSKEAFETGFIILAIIAFQPVLLRIEDVLERILLKGEEDLQSRFTKLGGEISNVAHEDDLEKLLAARFGAILDTTSVRLNLGDDESRWETLVDLLDRVGGPVTRHEVLGLGESGLLDPQAHTVTVSGWLRRKKRSRRGLAAARALVGSDEVFVPIHREGRCAGYLSIGEKAHGLRYSADELMQLSGIANHVGVALDNIRLLRENVEKKVIEEELQMARRIQAQLLPSGSPEIKGYDLSGTTVPSRHVGGDYYDFEVVDGNTLVLVVADVSGKGIPASLLMATLRAAVNSNQDAKKKPSAMLQRINGLLYQSTSPEEFATVFYGVVDLARGVLRYANAGHEFPYIVAADGVRQLEGSGIVLGCMPGFPYEEMTSSIPPGGALVLYTDGVTDAVTGDGEDFGQERLRAALAKNGGKPSCDLRDAILDDVRGFSREGDYHDDLTLVVLRRD